MCNPGSNLGEPKGFFAFFLKAYAPLIFIRGKYHVIQGFNETADSRVMLSYGILKLCQLGSKLFVGGHCLPEPNKSANDKNTYLFSSWGVENCGQHN